jgi:hypothetical protein
VFIFINMFCQKDLDIMYPIIRHARIEQPSILPEHRRPEIESDGTLLLVDGKQGGCVDPVEKLLEGGQFAKPAGTVFDDEVLDVGF